MLRHRCAPFIVSKRRTASPDRFPWSHRSPGTGSRWGGTRHGRVNVLAVSRKYTPAACTDALRESRFA
ncbi:hypothetical protein SXIM_11590 [Streptomyces xiamenensis]|uniref:Uncharacterized protein n=1 Tax=Streptomyces xiamenensis TaxID=408015 RepID=A0A0F7FR57_9ACTN|nr:hypothetical protein SXIM_11590 [Streptomyces xiamenensis]